MLIMCFEMAIKPCIFFGGGVCSHRCPKGGEKLRSGARYSKVPRTFRAPKSSCQTAIRLFLHVFNIRKTKSIAKFEGLEPRRWEDIKAIAAPEIGPNSFGTFEKQAPGPVS